MIRFFFNTYQRKIRRNCQMESERYEDSLENYKKAFLSEISLLKKEICSSPPTDRFEVLIQHLKEISSSEIEVFFDEIKNIYIDWINANNNSAYQKMDTLIRKYHLLKDTFDIKNTILFRARNSKNILTQWDMFHIPFNKRYLIKNQRYSLTGQPLLYLGFSILDIIHELGGTPRDIEDYKISTVDFKKSYKVIDFRNKLEKFLKNNIPIGVLDEDDYINPKKICFKKNFFEFILISCCSFERRKEHDTYHFCEEYVLPQLVAQYLKNKKKGGILYTSSKSFDKMSGFDVQNETSEMVAEYAYNDNIAVFTEFTDKHIYDRSLFNKIDISTPIGPMYIDKNLKLEDLELICEQLQNIVNTSSETVNLDFKYTKVAIELQNIYSNLQIGDDNFFDQPIGKFQLYLLYHLLYEKRNNYFNSL